MEIKEMLEKKETLRQSILDLVYEFQKETTLYDLDINGHQYYVDASTACTRQSLPGHYELNISINIK